MKQALLLLKRALPPPLWCLLVCCLQAFVDLALRVLEMLGAACLAAGSYQEAGIVPGEGELGMGTGSGERPHAQARAARLAAAAHALLDSWLHG